MRTYRFQQTSQCPRLLPRGVMLIVFAMTCSVSAARQVNVLERGYNKIRTGVNTAETVLTPANVSSGANQVPQAICHAGRRQDRGLSSLCLEAFRSPAERTTSFTSQRCTTPSLPLTRTTGRSSPHDGWAIPVTGNDLTISSLRRFTANGESWAPRSSTSRRERCTSCAGVMRATSAGRPSACSAST